MGRFSMVSWRTLQYCHKNTKQWDYYLAASGGYRAGYEQAQKDVEAGVVDDVIEYEQKDGEHQLSVMSFAKWEKEVGNMSFEESIKEFMYYFRFSDLRVHTDDKGNISFQGVARKNI